MDNPVFRIAVRTSLIHVYGVQGILGYDDTVPFFHEWVDSCPYRTILAEEQSFFLEPLLVFLRLKRLSSASLKVAG